MTSAQTQPPRAAGSGVAPGPAPLRVRVLGDGAILHADGRLGQPRTRKARAMLAYLALHAGPVSRQRLAALLWPDRAEEQARASVRQALYELRAILGPDALRTGQDRVAIDPAVLTTDLHALSAAAARNDPSTLLRLLQDAPSTILDGLDDVSDNYDDWLREERRRVLTIVADLARDQAARALDRGEADPARRLAAQSARFEPYDERTVRFAMRADAMLGEQARLHQRYRDFQETLAAALDVAPSPETQALYATLRRCEAAPPAARAANPASPLAMAQPDVSPVRRVRLVAAALCLAAILAGAAYLWWRTRPAAPARPVIAVLPFADLSRSRDGYFAAGVSEEIQNLLAHTHDVAVLGRASASEVAADRAPLEAARRLAVSHLLDGSVRSQGRRVLVIVRLVRVADGAQLWSERYDRQVADVFAVQSQIAAAVTRRFAKTLPSRAVDRPAPLPAVYDRYLSARALMRDRRATPLAAAEKALREAIAMQPGYAAPHALLSQVLMLEAKHPVSYGTLPYAAARAKATREAGIAIRLDPELGEAHAAVGFLSHSDAQSVPHYRRAVALDPQRPDFHRWLGQSLLATGHEEEAVREFARAVAIDPLWGLNYEHLTVALDRTGRTREAEQAMQRFFALSRDELAKEQLAMSYAQTTGRLADTYRHAARVAVLAPAERQSAFRLASVLALLGEREAALRRIAPDDWAGRLTVADRPDELARAALREGPAFWDTTASFWTVGDRLVASGHGAVLLQLFDARFGSVARFRPGELLDIFEVAPLVVALREAGRTADADRLLDRLRGELAAAAGRHLSPKLLLPEQATLAALSGERDRAAALVLAAAERAPAQLLSLPFRPASRMAALRSLAGDPRLAEADRLLLAYVNRERRALGWSPLSP